MGNCCPCLFSLGAQDPKTFNNLKKKEVKNNQNRKLRLQDVNYNNQAQ